MEQSNCPLCDTAEVKFVQIEGLVGHSIRCRRCGKFILLCSESLHWNTPIKDWKDLYVLQGFIREQNQSQNEQPNVTQDLLSHVKALVSYPKTPMEKCDRILRHFGLQSTVFEQAVAIDIETDFPIAYCAGPAEFRGLLDHLVKMGLLAKPAKDVGYHLTYRGWEKCEELKLASPLGNQAFVAMSFDAKFDSLYTDGLFPALVENGYKPLRVDKVPHDDQITDKILAEIRRSSLVIGDFSDHNRGVYYEVGFAQGLGIPIIRTCFKDEISKSHFDTRQYNHVLWTTPADMKQKLSDHIAALYPRKQTRL